MTRVRSIGSFTLAFVVAGQLLATGCGNDAEAPAPRSHDGGEAGRGGSANQGKGGSSAAGTDTSGGRSSGGGPNGGKSNGGSAGRAESGGSSGSAGSSDSAGSPSEGGMGGGAEQPARIHLKATGVPVTRRALSILNPSGDEYAGMGEHSGESVVLGLKIKLTGITLSEKPPGQAGGQGGPIFDWSAAPKELQIENGFSGVIEDSALLTLPEADYHVLQVSYLSQYELKAYAYLDTDKDGEVDTTIYTKASGVVSVAGIHPPAALVDLDYKHYGFTYTHNADSPTASTTTSFDFTLLPAPARVGSAGSSRAELPGAEGGASGDTAGAPGSAGKAGSGAEPGSAGADSGEGGAGSVPSDTNDLSITLFIDAYRVVKAWDGVPPSSPADHVDVLFPQGAGESRSNSFGVDLLDLYPIGQPTFGLQYLPTFAFANASEYTSESYLIAPSEPYLVANSQPMSVIFDGRGVPVIGRTGGNVDALSLQLGQAARMFERIGEDGSTPLYRYYVEYGIRDDGGVDDGGMYYHNDKDMAGHSVEGFRHLNAVGDSTTLLLKDGPRCNAEYDRCYGDRTAVMRRVR
jgi:hypothetical protein